MKRLLLTTVLSYLLMSTAFGQLPDGSIAPDWNVPDINGNYHSLYSQLNQGKVVFIDFFATWCGPCWNYHNTHSLENLYNSYGPAGTNQVRVFGIEADPATTIDMLYGIGGNTQGNWVAGTPYPVIDNAALGNLYGINYYPTIYGICPDRTITEVGQATTGVLYTFAQTCPALQPFQVSVQNVTGVTCLGSNNGSITLSKIGGVPPFNYQWSNGASTQTPALNNLPKGTYYCTATDGNEGDIVVGPIVINGPTSLLAISNTALTPVNCSNTGGSLTVLATGGGAPYNYQWNTGATSPTLSGLSPGNYSATVLDSYGCQKSVSVILPAAQVPTANAGATKTITCSQSVVTLNGSNSSTGSQYAYAWDTQTGNIVSGANSPSPQVNQPGTYVLTVLNTSSGCSATSSVTVNLNTTPPNAAAGAAPAINCNQPTASLSGTGPSGANISKIWTTNGGTIVSGATTYTPTISGAGTYYLTVTNTTNGCVKIDSVVVGADLVLPDVAASGGTLTCANTSVELSGSTTTAGASIQWTGPGDFSSSAANPEVDQDGLYTFTVIAPNGCENSLEVQVLEDQALPNVSVSGGAITCAIPEVTLQASSTTSGAELVWTNSAGEALEGNQPVVDQADTYTLTATGTNGCVNTTNVVVSENTTAPIANAGSDQLLNCNATALVLDGALSSTGNDITYAWTTANGNLVTDAATPTPTIDEPGLYVLQVSDNSNGCVASDEVVVNQNSTIQAQLESQNNVSCFGESNGVATVGAIGGAGNYTYLWSNGVAEATAADLSAGTYNVSISDSENCTAQVTVTIEQPSQLALEVNATGQSSFGAQDGTASAIASGGAGDYTYLWSNGATDATISGLAPGVYSVSITDANNCLVVQTVNVNSFDCTVAATISSQAIQCFGAADGAAAVSIDGGNEPYDFEWSNGATTASVSGLAPGDYSVSMTDGNNCPLTLSVSISQPSELQTGLVVATETSFGANDGTATVNPVGGTAPYDILWSTNETSASISGLSPGNYTVSITDAKGCQQVNTVSVAAFECLLAMDASVVAVSCFGANDGQAFVTPSGGYAPYNYAWSNGSSSSLISNLEPGEYSLSVTDDKNCPLVLNLQIEQPSPLNASLEVEGPDCANANNGAATVTTAGGTSPYSVLWSDGQTGITAENLTSGDYTVMVTDNNGCTLTQNLSLEVQDNQAPQVVAQNITIELNSGGLATINAAQIDNGSSDNCGIASMSLSATTFDCASVGTNTVELSVTDLNGNVSTATATVTVIDNSAPTLICADNLTTDCKGIAIYEAPAVLDNCANLAVPVLMEGFASGQTFPLGETTVSYQVTDAGGNTASCSFVVTVPQVLELSAETESVTCFGGNDGEAAISVTGGTEPYEINWNTGQSGPFIDNLTAGIYSASIVDAEGCSNTQVIEITEPAPLDVVDMEVINATGNEANGAIDITVAGGIAPYQFDWKYDGQSFSQEEDIQGLAPGIYEVVITDANACVLNIINIEVQLSVGLVDAKLDARLSLSPNPTAGFVNLECQGGLPSAVQIDVLDITGRLVQHVGKADAGTSHIRLDLGQFASGLYIVKLSSADGIVNRKVALQK